MGTYVIGDVHGQSEKLYTMLKGISLSDNDRVIFIGDVIDRGPGGWEILKMIKNSKNMEMIMGNHEELMLEFCTTKFFTTNTKHAKDVWECWERNGGAPTFKSIMDDVIDNGSRIVFDMLMWVQDLPRDMDLEVNGQRFHLVHGFPMMDDYDKVWERPTLKTKNPYRDRTVIIGHTPVFHLHAKTSHDMEMYMKGVTDGGGHLHIEHAPGFIDIDCGAAYPDFEGTRLAAIRLDDMSEFYA